MKKHMSILPILLISITFFTSCSQSSSKLSSFEIEVENIENGFNLVCKDGCAWQKLNFTSTINKEQAINNFGMTDNDKDRPENEVFLLFIKKTGNEVTLKGENGTAWSNLKFSFSKNKSQVINEMGMK